MFKLSAAIAVGAGVMLAAAAPTFAGETLTLHGILVADIGKDVDVLSESKTTDAKVLSAVVPAPRPIDIVTNAAGTVVVEVDLSDSGQLTKCTVIKTSGRASLDARALHTLQTAKYQAETVGGRPVGGAYAVNVAFDAAE
jgi:TonB family protein